MNTNMLYWCFNCSKITIPNQGLKCQYCLCEAIQQIKDHNNPAQYIPPTINTNQSTNRQYQQHSEDNQMDPFMNLFSMFGSRRMHMNMNFPMFTPSVSFIRIIEMPQQEEKNISVGADKFDKLQKVRRLNHECAICQEKQGSGVKLGCKHEFHDHCIKPWFNSANTCPCCRTAV